MSKTYPGLLLDWVGLRIRLDALSPAVSDRLFSDTQRVLCCDPAMNEILWEKKRYAFETARSDECRIFYTVRWIGSASYLYIGASPASLEHGCNVFGSLDVMTGAQWVVDAAQVELQAFLPPADQWECTRLDVTGNYALPDGASVALALKQLAVCDGARRRASNVTKGGNTVMWSPTSDLLAGKAYHKGPHLEHLMRNGRLEITAEQATLAQRLLRLELRIGARWFRRLTDGQHASLNGLTWQQLTPEHLAMIYGGFFEPLVGGYEVIGMERAELTERVASMGGVSMGAARSAVGTYRAIKDEGFDAVKASMSERTFYRHKKLLNAAGVVDAELVKGNVFTFKPIQLILAQPVADWNELRRAA